MKAKGTKITGEDIIKSDLSIYAKGIFWLLTAYAKGKSTCRIRCQTIESELHISRDTIMDGLLDLESSEIIKIDGNSKGDLNISKILIVDLPPYFEIFKRSRPDKREEYNKYLSQTDDEKYHAFVDYLYGNNEGGQVFEKCLSMENQISPKIFNILMKKYSRELIKRKISEMENRKDLLKRYVSFYRTLDAWCKRWK